MDLSKLSILEIIDRHFDIEAGKVTPYTSNNSPTLLKFVRDAYLNFNNIDRSLYSNCVEDIIKKIKIDENSKIYNETFSNIGSEITSFLKILWNETAGNNFVELDEHEQKEDYDKNYRKEIIIANVLKQRIIEDEIIYKNDTYILLKEQKAYFYINRELTEICESFSTFINSFTTNMASFVYDNKLQYAYMNGFKVSKANKYENYLGTMLDLFLAFDKSLKNNDITYIETFLKDYFYKKMLSKYRNRELEEEQGLKVKTESKTDIQPYERLNGKANKFGELRTINSDNNKYFFNKSELNNGTLKIYIRKKSYPKLVKMLKLLTTNSKENILKDYFFAISPHFYVANENIDITQLQKQYFYFNNKKSIDISTNEDYIILLIYVDNTISCSLGAGYFRTGYNYQILGENKNSLIKDKNFTSLDFSLRDKEFVSDFDDREVTVIHFMKDKNIAPDYKKGILNEDFSLDCPDFLKRVDYKTIHQIKLIEEGDNEQYLFNVKEIKDGKIYLEKGNENIKSFFPINVYIYEYLQTIGNPKRKELLTLPVDDKERILALSTFIKYRMSGKEMILYVENERLPILYNKKDLCIVSSGDFAIIRKNKNLNISKKIAETEITNKSLQVEPVDKDFEIHYFYGELKLNYNFNYLVKEKNKALKTTKKELVNLNWFEIEPILELKNDRLIGFLKQEEYSFEPLTLTLTPSLDDRLLRTLRQDSYSYTSFAASLDSSDPNKRLLRTLRQDSYSLNAEVNMNLIEDEAIAQTVVFTYANKAATTTLNLAYEDKEATIANELYYKNKNLYFKTYNIGLAS